MSSLQAGPGWGLGQAPWWHVRGIWQLLLLFLPLTEMRIGLTEEFCVGKSELRGEKVGLSLLGRGHCQSFHGGKLETDPHPLPKYGLGEGSFSLSRLWARNSGG